VSSSSVGASTLLVLAGDRSVAPIVQRALGAGWRVFAVDDGHQALTFLAGIVADVIVADLDTLATAGAFATAREREPRLASVPVIGVGAGAAPPFVARTLTRPLSDDDVRAAVAAVVA
jgi:DNA-binding response OmpR family regulator